MQIFQTKQIREIDAATIALEKTTSAALIERAADGLYRYLSAHIGKDKRVLVMAGPGNNGGDALAVAKRMLQNGYQQVDCTSLAAGKEPSFDYTQKHYDYLIDGLFGSGLNRPLEGYFAEVVTWINQQKPSTEIISIDLPSGLFGEDNRQNHPQAIVRADLVLGIQFPRLAFLLPENAAYIGKWVLIPMSFPDEVLQQIHTPFSYIEADELKSIIHHRNTFSHKGNFGHGLLIAGSYEMCGAAILSSRAALRSGIGLLNVLVPSSAYSTIQAAVPEAMVQRDTVSDKHFASIENIDFQKLNAFAIGPGLGVGDSQKKAFKSLLQRFQEEETPAQTTKTPSIKENNLSTKGQKNKSIRLVVDADALNMLAEMPECLDLLPAESILTPHPKEFDRIAGASTCGYERWEKACAFAQKHQVYIILKGAYTAIISPDGMCSFNSTGNPGMASGGSGDVLTGILLSLLAQDYTPYQACRLGVYLHGLSGDIALEKESVESLTAGDIILYLGKAFLSLNA